MRVLAMISGGADSTLMLHRLVAGGHEVRALHVNHGRRGVESDGDADACFELCRRVAVPCQVIDGPVDGDENLEARLRERRREIALSVADGDVIATGHTASDRAETVLYRLATSGGTRAVAVLPEHTGQWWRPLIDMTRDEVRAELAAMSEAWRDDATNLDVRFARNRIRADVIPQLETLNPQAVRNIARTADLLCDERDLVDGLAAAFVDDDGSIDLDRLQVAHVALQRAALRLAAGRAGMRVQHRDIEALRALGRAGREARSLPGGHRAERDRARLRFIYDGGPCEDSTPRA
jgi:tRNA(Ile)-lysidine synthase